MKCIHCGKEIEFRDKHVMQYWIHKGNGMLYFRCDGKPYGRDKNDEEALQATPYDFDLYVKEALLL